MKIGIITDPMDTKSSVKVYLSNLIKNLLKIHDPDKIYLIHAHRNDDPLYTSCREVILTGLYGYRFPSAVLANVWRPYQLKKYRLDIVHYAHAHAPLTFCTTDSKNVCLITTIGPVTHPEYYPWLSRYIVKISRILNRKMDAIITESESEKGEIVKFLGCSAEKVNVIPSGVDDIYRLLENKGQIRQELDDKYHIGSPFILYVGGYRQVKNGPALIQAFAELRKRGLEHKLVLVGQPVQKFEKVEKLIRELGLKDNIVSTGYIPRDDLPKFYNAAEVFVLPSFKESFGHVLVEAMACGCPVITSNVTAMPETVNDAGLLIDPYDLNGLTEGMYQVLTDNKLRQEMKLKSLKRSRVFSWDKCAQETMQVYKKLCS